MTYSNPKSVAASLGRLGGPLLLIGVLGVGTAKAGVHLAPGGAIIFATSESKAGPITDSHTASAPGLAPWNGVVESTAQHEATGAYAHGVTNLQTWFDPATFSVSSNAVGTVGEAGTVSGAAFAAVFFTVDTVQIFTAHTYMIPHTYPPHLYAFVANLNHGETRVISLVATPGSWTFSGRLPPGAYVFNMSNSFGPESENGEMTTYGAGIGFTNCLNPLVNQQPGDMTVRITETARFRVGTTGLAPTEAQAQTSGKTAMTFQWRKGLQDLSDDGRISGTQTNELVITDAAMSDTGLYDCVVTQDADVEPSSLVHLTVIETTDVPGIGASTALEMAAPSPSPFGDRTLILFSLPRAAGASLEVLDVSGRRVRQLLTRGSLEAGTHSVTWDGRDESGARSAAGVYFLRLACGAEQVVRRVVSLAGSR